MQEEFYFVRHGQTDQNLSEGFNKGLQNVSDISLNSTGRKQALRIRPLIASLPFKSIAVSPMQRALQTRHIIAPHIKKHYEIENLGECSAKIWSGLAFLQKDSMFPKEEALASFLAKVKIGLQEALSKKGPVLLVSHGGVHFSLCFLLKIANYGWRIENCGLAHFYKGKDGTWLAKRLF